MRDGLLNKDKNQNSLLKKIESELDKGCVELDSALILRLKKARAIALEQHKYEREGGLVRSLKQRLEYFGSLQRGMLAIGISVAVALLWLQSSSFGTLLIESAALEDLDILISADGIEFYEDFEFYQWLAENTTSV